MKRLVKALFLLVALGMSTSATYAQGRNRAEAEIFCKRELSDSATMALYKEIQTFEVIEHQLVGTGKEKSVTYARLQSFERRVGKVSLTAFRYDSSHVLRYYAFMRLMDLGHDSLITQFFKENVYDYTTVLYRFPGTQERPENIAFNQLILCAYSGYVDLLYKEGGGAYNFNGAIVYVTGDKDTRLWKIKREEIETLLLGTALSLGDACPRKAKKK